MISPPSDTNLQRHCSARNGGKMLLLGLVASLLISGCAAFSPEPRRVAPPRELQWPSAPLEPRIQWLRDIRDYRDAGINKGFWARVAGLIVGGLEQPIVKPYGIHADTKERLFIVDTGAAAVHFMDLKEQSYKTITGTDEMAFQNPVGITEDAADNLYITDSNAARVYRYDLKTEKLTLFTSFKPGRPTGIAFSQANNRLYVTDTTAHQIVVFDLQGNERFRIGGRGDVPGRFNYPTDLFIDARGWLYVTDALNSRIQVFSPSGRVLHTFGMAGDSEGNLQKPKGVAVDSDGNIYVADALLDTVQIFDITGRLLLVLGEAGPSAGQFWMPSGLFIDKDDQLYVADSYNCRVQVFRYLKKMTNGDDPATPPQPAGAGR